MILVTGTSTQTIHLPPVAPAQILADGISADGGTLTVTGADYGAEPVSTVTWTSADDGQDWSLG